MTFSEFFLLVWKFWSLFVETPPGERFPSTPALVLEVDSPPGGPPSAAGTRGGPGWTGAASWGSWGSGGRGPPSRPGPGGAGSGGTRPPLCGPGPCWGGDRVGILYQFICIHSFLLTFFLVFFIAFISSSIATWALCN